MVGWVISAMIRGGMEMDMEVKIKKEETTGRWLEVRG
jgi:hypothetical protein